MRRTRYVKVYGVQRSGTNWIKYLLENNFMQTIEVNLPLGDKHYPPAPLDAYQRWLRDGGPAGHPYSARKLGKALARKRIGFVVVVKPLLPWLVSFHRYRQLKAKASIPLTPEQAIAWAESWVERNVSFYENLRVLGFPHVVVSYCNVLADPREQVRQMGRALDLSPRPGPLDLSMENRMKRGQDTDHGAAIASEGKFSARFYLERQYLNELEQEVIDALDGYLGGLTTDLDRYPLLTRE